MIAGPVPVHERVVVDYASPVRIIQAEYRGNDVAVDARVQTHRAEDFSMAADPVRKRADEMGNICETLMDVPVRPVTADGPVLVLQDFARGDEPEPGVTHDCGGGGPLVGHGSPGLTLR